MPDSQKIIWLGKLADYYYIFKLNNQADSVLQQQLSIAQHSNNSNLIRQALFGDAILNIGTSAPSESFEKTIQFINKGIDYANQTGQHNYQVLGYIRMADIRRRRGQYKEALDNCMNALQIPQNELSDSVKATMYLGMGDTYMAMGNAVNACKNYNTAFDIAIKMNSFILQSKIHHSLSEMYRNLDDSSSASNELNESLASNKLNGNMEGLMRDYFDLARLTDEKFFIEEAIHLADSLDNYKYLLSAKRLMLVYYYVKEKDTSKSIHYLENEPGVKESYINNGPGDYYQTKGNIYLYSGYPDSALNYYLVAMPEFEKKFDPQSSQIIFGQIAKSYADKGDISNAIRYFLKTLTLDKQMNNAGYMADDSKNLSALYEKQNDFKKAFIYSKLANTYKDSLRELSKENTIALLGVERENFSHRQELLIQQKRANNDRNLQFTAITILIVVVFFGMLFIGSFPVSPFTVKLMGYFFFISLFEFIVLLIDNLFLNHVIHNQPLILWLIKIGLIGLLVPFQHFLEHNLIKLLESKKLIEARTKFSFKKMWGKFKKPFPTEEGLEEDTAVL